MASWQLTLVQDIPAIVSTDFQLQDRRRTTHIFDIATDVDTVTDLVNVKHVGYRQHSPFLDHVW